jgi:hypothetical protein
LKGEATGVSGGPKNHTGKSQCTNQQGTQDQQFDVFSDRGQEVEQVNFVVGARVFVHGADRSKAEDRQFYMGWVVNF